MSGVVPTIYHGTPMTPRAALNALGVGRAFCVSFYRPDDVEVVEAISPAVMFRQWRIFGMASRFAQRVRMGGRARLVGLLPLVGAAPIPSRTLGCHPRYAGRAQPDQRRAAKRLALWPLKGRAAVAHGWAARSVPATGRAIRPRLHRLDRTGDRAGVRGLVSTHGRTGGGDRQSVARNSHDARRDCRQRISICKRGRNERRTERVAL